MLKRILTAPFVLLLGAWLAFLEWLWTPLNTFIRRLTRWRFFRTIERGVGKLPPYAALALFLVPMIMLLPIKLLGLFLLANGKRLLGLAVFVVGKIIGTGLAAWIYNLTEPALSRLAWFVTLRAWFMRVKGALYERIRSNAIYRYSRRKLHTLRGHVSSWFRVKN
jgi:hypothetical protein